MQWPLSPQADRGTVQQNKQEIQPESSTLMY